MSAHDDEVEALFLGDAHDAGRRLAVFQAARDETRAVTLDVPSRRLQALEQRPLELVRERGRSLLLLELAGGTPLARFIGQALDVRRFLQLAIASSVALGQMHRRGIVHKDIKPTNVLVDSATHRVWLTGFGIASRLVRERQSPDAPELIAGTLAYMAPEQTGRMNRSVDSRCDLYSFGITLYQLLTGSLPFTASDPSDWVHCHVARRPPAPRAASGEIPHPLSAIIMKLMAKTPDERYQTAEGVELDLRRCLAEWESRGSIDPFALGERDIADRLLIPEQLYGREGEVAVLIEAFERVMANGVPRLVLVRGQPGTGKSSVVAELHRVLLPARGLFASGKFDQLGRHGPYASLAEGLRGLVRWLLGRPEPELNRWRLDLRQALDPNAALVTALVPELRLILGDHSPLADVPARAAKDRFQLTLRRLIGVFARREHPLALFLDDLQWLDTATLDLLGDLLVQPEPRHLLLVCAYRDNEVDAAHPLTRRLGAIRTSGASLHEIALGPLKQDDLARCLADALHCEERRALPLARVINEKTAGNPLFVHQFIDALAREGLIAFEPGAARWSWDLAPIQAKGHTENVVDLMVEKLRRLPPRTKEALKHLACLGNMAEASTLAIAREASDDEVHSDLWEALRLELIVRAGHSYRFAHDRLQEAAYSLVQEELRPLAHLEIGRRLLRHFTKERRDESVFLIVWQLNRGSSLMTSREERQELAGLNWVAAQRAQMAAAHSSALHYSSAGASLLADEPWERRHPLRFALELHRAEGEFLTGYMVAAERRLIALEPHVADDVERALVVCLLADVYVALQRLERRTAVCLEYLRQAGLDIATQATGAQARVAYDRVWSTLGGRSIEELVELPLMGAHASRATLDVLAKVVRCALAQMDENLLCVVLCTAVLVSLEHGH